MADNSTLNPGVGGDVIAADDVGGVKYQVVKLDLGADGVSAPVSGALPVSGTFYPAVQEVFGPLTDTELRATPVPVSGTVTANTGLSQPLTDAQIRASALPVSGTVAVSNMVAQGLTDAQLRATPVPVEAYGELVEAIEAMRFAVQALTRSIGQMLPDTANRMRVNIEAGTLPTVTTLATMTNQTQIGGLAATEQIPALMRLGADSLRRNISVS